MTAVTVDSKVQGGTPCFSGTRVPASSLFDLLRQGYYTVEQILEDFPTVTRQQIDTVLELAKSHISRHAEHVNAR
jgi:uncharacterized protein (DUF433 family)